ncbi:MAG: hypothetical protein CMI54_03650 [Parcubacteria group bacterium]|mgnify:CR=1 FL=1|nr:hypothetical protein [Parcubacteria group bacterium]|tara:strand:+ start:15404 stop:16279 length:876 start_codon:yes stop_codon:yes gene_type:complete
MALWQFFLIGLIIVNTLSIVLTKAAADKLPKRSVGVFYQYALCAIIASFYAVFVGGLDFSTLIILVMIIGAINAFGNYFQWQASHISLSKTSLFFPVMDIMTINLAIIFLAEGNIWNLQLVLGVLISFSAIYLFRFSSIKKDGTKETLNKNWFIYLTAMITIFGSAAFLVKVFSLTISSGTFLAGWYIGAFFGSIGLLALTRENPKNDFSKMTFLTVLPVSTTILGTLLLMFLTYQFGGPVSIVLPFRMSFSAFTPALIGLFIFKERKTLSWKEKLAMALGVIGAALIISR